MKKELLAYAAKTYQVQIEYLWQRAPGDGILRHEENQKWFALFMSVPSERLGLARGERVDILDLRCPDLMLRDVLLGREGYLPAYHMHKGNWITVLLDGSVPFEEVCERLEESYLATAPKKVREKLRPPKDWLIPANPKYYDVQKAFQREKVIDWKQGKGIRVGDTVFMYLAAPVSAILFQCRVVQTDIPYLGETKEISIPALMRIELIRTYEEGRFPLSLMGEKYGVRYVRGPRGVPAALAQALRL